MSEDKTVELEELKTKLDEMGVKYHHKAGLDTLTELYNEALEKQEEEEPVKEEKKPLTRKQKRDYALELIMCNITCMDPTKKDWQGEIITGGNSITGTVRKFIPYNCARAEYYPIPRILLDALKSRTYLQATTTKNHLGQEVTKTVRRKSFTIVENASAPV